MSKGLFKIYVGNLDYKVTEFAVRRLFEPFGELEDVAMATDKQTGKPRGFAIVMMRDHDEARKAIGGVQGRRLMGRPLVVNEAIAKKNRKAAAAGNDQAQLVPTAGNAPAKSETGERRSTRTPGARFGTSSSRDAGTGSERSSNRNPRRSGGRNPRRGSAR
ncbi:MAG: RNA-binding protein [Planctomycetota bacterium]|nr:RNA-binding protein [Planctomycetota bacterium]